MSSLSSLWICPDANIIVHLVADVMDQSLVVDLWRAWHEDGRSLAAPTLLHYEVSNALHRHVVHGNMQPEEAEAGLDIALKFDIVLYGDADLHRRALRLSQEFALPAAYDAHYLALAERLGAEFWTLDRRLYNTVKEVLPWVRLVGMGE